MRRNVCARWGTGRGTTVNAAPTQGQPGFGFEPEFEHILAGEPTLNGAGSASLVAANAIPVLAGWAEGRLVPGDELRRLPSHLTCRLRLPPLFPKGADMLL